MQPCISWPVYNWELPIQHGNDIYFVSDISSDISCLMSSSQENCTNCDEKHQSRLLSRINDTSSCTKWVPTIFYPILGMLWSRFPFVALSSQAHKIDDTAASSCIARRPSYSLPRDQTVIWARHSQLSNSSKLHLLFSQLMHSLLWLVNPTWAMQKPFDHSGRCIIEDCQCWSWL